MKDILTAPWMVEMVRTATKMYNRSWDERNGGNVSLLLEEAQVSEYLDVKNVVRTMDTGFAAPTLDGKYFLVTGQTGAASGESPPCRSRCNKTPLTKMKASGLRRSCRMGGRYTFSTK